MRRGKILEEEVDKTVLHGVNGELWEQAGGEGLLLVSERQEVGETEGLERSYI